MTGSYIAGSTSRTDLSIDDRIWDHVPSLSLDFYPWQEYAAYKPATTAKLILCGDRLAVRMQTDEKPLLARAVHMNDDVFLDSCMEFFIQPDITDQRYINFELNPKGTLLLGIGPDRATRKRVFTDPGRFRIATRCEENLWTLYWEIPFDFLREFGFQEIGGNFRGNFYKCGDETGSPHYGCWNPVRLPAPDFHVPAFFGDFIVPGQEILP